ncbi:MAG: hypothetical protein ACKVT0_21980 [Planctomycetaceae bacterium]
MNPAIDSPAWISANPKVKEDDDERDGGDQRRTQIKTCHNLPARNTPPFTMDKPRRTRRERKKGGAFIRVLRVELKLEQARPK